MNCSRGEVILLPIPITDLSSRKVRPAIIVGFGSFPGDLFVVPLTSQLTNVAFALAHWAQAGLNVPSGIKAQLATVDSTLALKARFVAVFARLVNEVTDSVAARMSHREHV